MNKHKLAENLTKFYLRHGRGHGLLDFIIQLIKNIVYVGGLGFLIENWIGFKIPYPIFIIIAFVYEIGCYTLGYFDEKVGFWKFQNSYSSKELNPFFEEMNNRLKSIENKL